MRARLDAGERRIILACPRSLQLLLLAAYFLLSPGVIVTALAEPTHGDPYVCNRSSFLISSALAAAATTKAASSAAFQPQDAMRAWHCHGRNQRDLVDRLAQAGIAKSEAVKEVLRLVDRRNYVHPDSSSTDLAYMDAPQSIGLGQTISAPHMHAHVLEEILPALQKQPEPLALLDVGCGSGYLTACFGRWLQARPPREGLPARSDATAAAPGPLGKTGKVYGIDIYPHLVDLSRQNMKRDDSDLLASGMVTLEHANGWKGLPDAAPFDAIHVGAAAADFPRLLAMQLKVGGVLIVPIGPTGGTQYLYRVDRVAQASEDPGAFVEADYRIKELLGVRYVPLVKGP